MQITVMGKEGEREQVNESVKKKKRVTGGRGGRERGSKAMFEVKPCLFWFSASRTKNMQQTQLKQ